MCVYDKLIQEGFCFQSIPCQFTIYYFFLLLNN